MKPIGNMINSIKAVKKQVVRFFTEVRKRTNYNLSGTKTTLVVVGIFVGMFALGFALLGGVGSAFLGAINEFADNGMTHWVIWKFALALMLTLLFIFTVGIPLMIDEARNWFTKVAACGVIVGAAVRMLSVFGPIVAGHPRASAILTVTVLILCVGAIAHMLGHGESIKGLSWFGKVLAVVFVIWLVITGLMSSCRSTGTAATDQKNTPQNPTAATKPEYRWCYYLPPGVNSARPDVRARCLKASVDVDTPSVLAFSAYQYHGGELTTSTFFLNRASGEGKWETNNGLSGSGDWYELPVVPGTPGLAYKGQFRDVTKDNAWIPFDITTSAGPLEEQEEKKEEHNTPPSPKDPIVQVRSQPTA